MSQDKSAYINGPTDDRVEIYQVTDPKLQAMANGVPELVGLDYIVDQGNGTSLWSVYSIALCQGEPFAGEFIGEDSECSAFLVGPDLVATASHCIINHLTNRVVDLSDFGIVFGDRMIDATQTNLPLVPGGYSVPNDEIYYPVAYWMGAGFPTDDWALLRLDRPVKTTHPILPLETSKGTVTAGGGLALLGYPSSFPEKLSWATEESLDAVYTNDILFDVDAYVGDSGGAVVDLATYKVQALMSASTPLGDSQSLDGDYEPNATCPVVGGGVGGWQSIRCPSGNCPSYAQVVDPLLPYVAPVGSPAPVNTSVGLGVQLTPSSPQIVTLGAQPALFERGADDNLYVADCQEPEQSAQSGGVNGCNYYGGWNQIPGITTDAVPVVVEPDSTIDTNIYIVVKQKGTSKLRYAKLPWPNIPPNLAWLPVGDDSLLTNDGPGATFAGEHLVVLARDPNNAVQVNALQVNGAWQGWSVMPGEGTISPPRAVQLIDATFEAFVAIRGTDSHIYVNEVYDTGNGSVAWGTWGALPGGGVTLSEPTLVSEVGKVRAVVRGTDNHVYFNDVTWGYGWTGWYAGPAGNSFSGIATGTWGGYLWLYSQGADRNVNQAVATF